MTQDTVRGVGGSKSPKNNFKHLPRKQIIWKSLFESTKPNLGNDCADLHATWTPKHSSFLFKSPLSSIRRDVVVSNDSNRKSFNKYNIKIWKRIEAQRLQYIFFMPSYIAIFLSELMWMHLQYLQWFIKTTCDMFVYRNIHFCKGVKLWSWPT